MLLNTDWKKTHVDIWITSLERHKYSDAFCLPSSACILFWYDFQKTKKQSCGTNLNHPLPLTTSVINPDFFPCPFLYVVVVVITIIQQRQALSVKAWCSFPSICLWRWRAFPPYLVWPFFFFPVSENACGLKLFKCSLLRTSCLITYLLDLLSHIFSLKDKLKEKCGLSSSQREPRDLKRIQENIGSNK